MSLGSHLRSEREKKGVTLEQLASATKINIRLLYALEEDRYQDLPARPFIRGFVASYCKFIGINGEELLQHYHQFLDEKSNERPNKEGGHQGYAFEKRGGDQSRTTLWMVMSGFVVVGGIVLLVLKPALKHRRGSHIDKLKQITASPSPSPTDSPGVIATPSPSPSVSALATKAIPTPKASAKPVIASTAPITTTPATTTPSLPVISDPLNKGDDLKGHAPETVALKSLVDATVRYQVDDRPVMTYHLRKGISIALRAIKNINVEVSNPKSVIMRYRAKDYRAIPSEKLGFSAGKVKESKEIFAELKPLVKTADPTP